MKNIFRIFVLICCVTTGTVQAALVEGLYEAEILVSSQSRSERDEAMREGLAEVFAKVSGRSDVATLGGVNEAINGADRFLQQYLYRSLEDAQYSGSRINPDSQVAWFRFDEKAVNEVLRKNNLPVWGRTRPATLVWLAVEQDGSRYILGSDNDPELRNLLEYQAKRQGLALVLPLLDLQDQTALSFADVWGNFQDAILSASTRYQAEAILVGRINLSRSDVWQSRWTLYEGTQAPQTWQFQGTYVDEVLRSGVIGSITALANKYAMAYSDDNPDVVYLSVVDLSNLTGYARVEKYLKSLEQVKTVQPVKVDENHVRFRLNIRGNPDGLVQTIGLGNVLRQEQGLYQTGDSQMSGEQALDPDTPNFGGSFNNEPMLGQYQTSDYTYRLLP